MKIILIIFIGLFVIGCDKKTKDLLDAATNSVYTKCKIISSEAVFTSSREKDESQCWADGTYSDKDSAMTWCKNKIQNYCNSEYPLLGCSALVQQISNDGC